jgi:glycosyltransferase involved in cell wall biosynthesis
VPRVLFGVTVPVTAQSFLRDQLTDLAGLGWDVHLVTSPDDGYDLLADLPGVTVHAIPMRRPPAPLHDARSLVAWRRLMRDLEPDVVVASTPKAGLLGMVAARRARVPVRLYHIRGLRAEGLSGLAARISLASERLAIACSTDVLCDSLSLQSALIQLGLLPSGKGVVLGAGSCCGVDTSRFRPPSPSERQQARESFGLGEGDLVVGFVGRLAVDKGIPELIEAAESAHRANPRLRLVLVGPMEDSAALGRDIERLNASDWAAAPGSFPDPLPAYWAFDLFCLPSHREGFPISPLEAQACGLPVITTTATGCIDSISPGDTGLAVSPGSADELRVAIQALAADPARAHRMGVAARERVIHEYDQVEVRQRFVGYLAGLWAGAKARAA